MPHTADRDGTRNNNKDISRYLEVNPDQGLSANEARRRQQIFGLNSLGRSKSKPVVEILIDQFKSLLTALLAGAAALSFVFDDVAEGIAILVVILINSTIGFWAEFKAVRSMAALRKMGRATTRVRRDGRVQRITDEEVVPGDIILLDAGDVVTADIRLLESVKLQSDESLLTGESAPVDKSVQPEDRPDLHAAPLHDREGVVFKGTTITRGSCLGIATATGKNTELGNISTLVETARGAASPLERRLQKLSEQLLLAVLLLTALLTVAGIISGRDMLLMVKTGIALAVAAIPEGLPIVATLALARGMWKLAEHNALIERLSAVETLGSVNVIFTDKTGTLTENKMTATGLNVPDATEQIPLPSSAEAGQRALRVCALCYSGGGNPDQLTDPMESALVTAAAAAGFGPERCARQFPRISEEAFDPNIRMMATVHAVDQEYLYLVKGAPEAVLAAASHVGGTAQDHPLTDEMKSRWLAQTEALAGQGLRILALAEKRRDSAYEAPFEGLTFLGLVSLKDPPRADAAAAVKSAQEAGVRVIMVTGDNAVTGANIAQAVGIADAEAAPAVEGHMMTSADKLGPAKRQTLLKTAVFARMTPRQKLDLIDLYQQNGAVVAMTGDGVNDAPALKKADVGIAMGRRGTEVAKEAAEMILKDDAFASIVIAIQQGRVIFANIRKFVIYLLSCNLSEVMVVTFAMLAGLPLPLLPLQILFLNLVTDVFPALALGFGRGDSEILHRPPRPKQEGLLRRRHWQAIISYSALMTLTVLGAFIWALNRPGHDPADAATIAFLTLALGQLWHVFNMRSRRADFLKNQIVQNPFVWAALVICLGLIAMATFWPLFADVLNIRPPDQSGWVVIMIASLLPLILAQLAKLYSARRYQKDHLWH